MTSPLSVISAGSFFTGLMREYSSLGWPGAKVLGTNSILSIRPSSIAAMRTLRANGEPGENVSFIGCPFWRHCEPTGRANARPMTGSAKQSRRLRRKTGLLRRGVYHRARRRRDPLAPRNDGKQPEWNADVLRRWIYRRGAQEEPCGLPPHGEEGRQGLARAWR